MSALNLAAHLEDGKVRHDGDTQPLRHLRHLLGLHLRAPTGAGVSIHGYVHNLFPAPVTLGLSNTVGTSSWAQARAAFQNNAPGLLYTSPKISCIASAGNVPGGTFAQPYNASKVKLTQVKLSRHKETSAGSTLLSGQRRVSVEGARAETSHARCPQPASQRPGRVSCTARTRAPKSPRLPVKHQPAEKKAKSAARLQPPMLACSEIFYLRHFWYFEHNRLVRAQYIAQLPAQSLAPLY